MLRYATQISGTNKVFAFEAPGQGGFVCLLTPLGKSDKRPICPGGRVKGRMIWAAGPDSLQIEAHKWLSDFSKRTHAEQERILDELRTPDVGITELDYPD